MRPALSHCGAADWILNGTASNMDDRFTVFSLHRKINIGTIKTVGIMEAMFCSGSKIMSGDMHPALSSSLWGSPSPSRSVFRAPEGKKKMGDAFQMHDVPRASLDAHAVPVFRSLYSFLLCRSFVFFFPFVL